MKTKLIVILMICLFAASAFAAPRIGSKSSSSMSAVVNNDTYIDVNNCLMFVTNHGNFARDLAGVFGQGAGTFYPFSTVADIDAGINDITINFASGIWVGAVDSATGDTLIALSEYDSEYRPGVVINPLTPSATFDPDWGDAKYRVFKIYRSSAPGDPEYDEYMTEAVPQGAPTRMEGSELVPDVLGDQMLWAVYNDLDGSQHGNDAGNTAPLGLEIKQTVFGFDREDPLGEVVFIRYRIYNKGTKTLDNTFFSVWADPDVGDAGDDIVGCDTTLGLGFCYNADNNDAGYYGSTPPALGYDFFQGPLLFTGDDADTAQMWDFTKYPGYVNMSLLSFNKYINGTDPNSYVETYNYMQGLNSDGSPYTYNGTPLSFVHSGDPTIPSGDIDFAPDDRRFMQSTGNITFRPGDSTEIIFGQVIGRSSNRLTSLAVMKYNDQFAQKAYDEEFQVAQPPVAPDVEVTELDGTIVLEWSDTSEVDHGSYPFEGYTILQGESSTGPWERIAVYDVVNGVQFVFDQVLDPLTGALETRAVQFGTDTELRHYFGTSTDRLTGLSLYNYTTYYFRVEAYTVDQNRLPKTLVSATNVTATPHKPTAGSSFANEFNDVLELDLSKVSSDGVVTPIVVDPEEFTGHDYMVVFDLDAMDESFWRLVDATTSTILLDSMYNQSNNEDYPIVDGFQIKVAGPQFGVVAIDEVAGAGGAAIDPPDNVMFSLNSTADWYVASDAGSDFSRMNWRGRIGTYDWEFRFTDPNDVNAGSGYYDWNTDLPQADRAPFEVWNIGIGTPGDASDDVRINFSFIDDDASGAWTYNDRVYPWEQPYVEPVPGTPTYVWDDDFWIGRIVLTDYSHNTTSPAPGTIVRFTTAKINTPADTFQFTAQAPNMATAGSEVDLENIKTVPNPYYAYGPYDANAANRKIKFTNLPPAATIRIFNLGGDQIAVVEHPQPDNVVPSEAYWNVLTSNNLPVASGIYVYAVEAPGFGQKIGKMAVFTEIEVLDVF